MRAVRNSRLWVRLLAICLLAAVVPVLAGGHLTAGGLEEDARAQARARRESAAELGAAIVENFVLRARTKLEHIGRLLVERGAVPVEGENERSQRRAVVDRLDAQVEVPDQFLELQYYAGAPQPQLVGNRTSPEVQIAQGNAPHGTASGLTQQPLQLNVGSPIVDLPLRTGEPLAGASAEQHLGFTTVPLSVPVLRASATVGVLVGYLDLRGLGAELAPVAASDLGLALVDDRATKMVAVGAAPAPDDAERAEAPLRDLGWRLVAEGSRTAALAAAAAARQRAFGWTLAGAGLSVVLALLASAWIVRPIRVLTQVARDMAAGDLGARARLRRSDEIGALGEAFDRMATALQRLDRARSDFVATVSHELRTPLTALRATIDNLGDGVLGDLQPRQRDALRRAQAETERLQAIVRDTLQLARLEAGAEPLRPVDCDLAEVARTAAAAAAAQAAPREVRIEVHGHGRCRGDPELLQRVAANLLDNAIKFSPRGGRVLVEIEGGRLRVRDQGQGFTTDRPFEPFVQGASDGVRNPGVGLGLSIVDRLVRLHGGTVTAKSDGGGVVTVQLPEAT